MKKRIFTENEIELMRLEYAKLKSLRKVAGLFKTSTKKVSKLLDVAMSAVDKNRKLLEKKDEIIGLYLSGKSTTELGVKFGCCKQAILVLLKKQGIETRTLSEQAKLSVLERKGSAKKIFKEFDDVELILSMYYSGASYCEIAGYFGCKLTVIADLNEAYMEKSERQEAFKERQSDIGLKGVAGFKRKMLDPKFAKRMSDRISGENNICKLPGVKDKILADWKQNKNKRVAAILKVRFRKKTSFEKRVEDVIMKNNLPYFYCGDGAVVIGGKCPDFIHMTEKIVVEVFNDIHHKIAYGDIMGYKQARTLHFEEFGYNALFIPEQFINDDAKILKILSDCHKIGLSTILG
jgi:very-short-patch-repair endonuclease